MSIDAQSRYHRYNSQQQTHGTNNMPVVQSQQQQSGSNNSAPIMSSSQRFCLRWNNHQSNLLSVFDQLLQDESFVDVTLAVEGQLLRAHKMVLSACSPYFQALFVSHPDKHPIVILKDVPYIDMRSLLDFMYRGEVSVDQDRLTAFLRVAESLRIKGLTEVNEDKCDLPSITSSLLGSGGGNVNSNSYHQRSFPSKRPSTGLSSGGNMGAVGTPGQIGSQAMSPLLGNALAQPKRKRGRPRKFSGSSNGSGNEMRSETDAEGDDADAEDPLGDNSVVKEETQVQDSPMVGTSREQDNYSNNEEYQSENHHHLYLENNQNHSNIQPSVTFQLLPILPYDESSSVKTESVIISRENYSSLTSRSVPVIQTTPISHDTSHFIEKLEEDDTVGDDETTGVHFLTDDEVNNGLLVPKLEPGENDSSYYVDSIDSGGIKSKVELLEYVHRDDGTVMCKVCGQILASRTHWYRHKYKVHIVNPSPLFKCTKCNVFFKSRRGYIGHLHSRHPKQKSSVGDHRTSSSSIDPDVGDNQNANIFIKKTTEQNNQSLNNMKSTDWEIQREKEEKLVADIINRVKKECEAQGTTVTRRGYSRRQTIMNS